MIDFRSARENRASAFDFIQVRIASPEEIRGPRDAKERERLEMQGLRVSEFAPETVERVRPLFPAEASIRNPLDMISSANPAGYRASLDAVLSDPNVDSAVAIFTPPLGVRTPDVAEAIGEVAQRHPEKPVLAVLMGREGLPQGKSELHRAGVPAYVFPESAARALGALVRYGEILARPPREIPALDVERERAGRVLARARAAGLSKLSELDALAVVRAYGVRTADAALACGADDAVRVATAMGFPVVLKVVSPQIVHKTDVGGVRVGLADADAVREAYAAIMDSVRRRAPEAAVDGVVVQRMAAGGGRELIAGITRVPDFGALLAVGLGGVYVEAIRDVQLRLAPVDGHEALEMLRSLRSSRILGPIRGEPAVDVDAVADTLVRLGLLADHFPEIAELDVNPLRVGADGALALDARVLLS